MGQKPPDQPKPRSAKSSKPLKTARERTSAESGTTGMEEVRPDSAKKKTSAISRTTARTAVKTPPVGESMSVERRTAEPSVLPPGAPMPALTEDELRARVAQKAFELFERRGREGGNEMADWLEAERLVRAELQRGNGGQN